MVNVLTSYHAPYDPDRLDTQPLREPPKIGRPTAPTTGHGYGGDIPITNYKHKNNKILSMT